MSPVRILIVGGSTRAAADSVRRAGWQPVCADLFADLDLRRTAEVIPVRCYPESLPEDVAKVRADGWFYCGALENRPDIITEMLSNAARLGPLLGTAPEALSLVRNPHWLMDQLRQFGIRVLDLADSSRPPVPDGTWLQKPLASAGGRSIRIWDRAAINNPFLEPHYFQRRVDADGFSAIFRLENGKIDWLGAASEIEPNSACHPPARFSYCGSRGPLRKIPFNREKTVTSVERFQIFHCENRRDRASNRIAVRGSAVFQATIQQQLTAIAKTLARNVPGLRGLVGLDFRIENNTVWLLEVNPRYTASIEVLELTSGRSFLNPDATESLFNDNAVSQLDSRVIAIQKSFVDSRHGQTEKTARGLPRYPVIAKQILYAQSTFKAPDLGCFLHNVDPWQVPLVADIPMPGSLIESGWPICTVFAGGATAEIVRAKMHRQIDRIQAAVSGQGSLHGTEESSF
jgi:predicted ATP-grasp superfamily ATP-dependent carboligase